MLRIGLVILMTSCAILMASPAHSETEFSLQLRWSHQFQFAGYYMALEKGYGVAFLEKDEDLETLIKKADDALYRAKERGRNRVEVVGEGRGASGTSK